MTSVSGVGSSPNATFSPATDNSSVSINGWLPSALSGDTPYRGRHRAGEQPAGHVGARSVHQDDADVSSIGLSPRFVHGPTSWYQSGDLVIPRRRTRPAKLHDAGLSRSRDDSRFRKDDLRRACVRKAVDFDAKTRVDERVASIGVHRDHPSIAPARCLRSRARAFRSNDLVSLCRSGPRPSYLAGHASVTTNRAWSAPLSSWTTIATVLRFVAMRPLTMRLCHSNSSSELVTPRLSVTIPVLGEAGQLANAGRVRSLPILDHVRRRLADCDVGEAGDLKTIDFESKSKIPIRILTCHRCKSPPTRYNSHPHEVIGFAFRTTTRRSFPDTGPA